MFFAHPHSPWERGTNENTNCLVHRYLPKGTPITSHQPYPGAIANELNNGPRSTLDYLTPQEAFTQLIVTTPLDTSVDNAPLSGQSFTGEASQYRCIQSACFRLFTASERF